MEQQEDPPVSLTDPCATPPARAVSLLFGLGLVAAAVWLVYSGDRVLKHIKRQVEAAPVE